MTEKIIHHFAITDQDRAKWSKQEFKGVVIDKEVRFPKVLGAKHPFDFEDVEKLCKKYGVVNAILNKTTNSIVTDFEIVLQLRIADSYAHLNDFDSAEKMIQSAIETAQTSVLVLRLRFSLSV